MTFSAADFMADTDDAVTSIEMPSCATCDFMRREGNVMRCYYDPPQAQFLGTVPSKIEGAPPQIVVTGISPEVHPDRFCHHHTIGGLPS